MVSMKYKLILLSTVICLLFSGNLQLRGQFTITSYPPPSDFTFDDLWHFNITGLTGSNYTQFYVALRVFDASNTLLVKSNSSYFDLQSGGLYINKANMSAISPFTTLFYDNTYQTIVGNGDFFPAGIYNVTVTLLGRPTDGEFSELAEDNFTVEVQMFMPPLLIFPEDKDTIDYPNPVLTWLPAFQASYGQQILYDLRLVEMYSGQTSQQAITANPVFFEQFNLPVTALPYPPGSSALQLDHTYAWQVTATINGVPVGYSQIWQFTYAIPEPDTNVVSVNRQYYTLFDDKTGPAVKIVDNHIPLKVEESYLNEDTYLKFRIYNQQNELVASSDNLNIQVLHGVKYIKISICSNPFILQLHKVYLIETINSKGLPKYIRIKNEFDPINCD